MRSGQARAERVLDRAGGARSSPPGGAAFWLARDLLPRGQHGLHGPAALAAAVLGRAILRANICPLTSELSKNSRRCRRSTC